MSGLTDEERRDLAIAVHDDSCGCKDADISTYPRVGRLIAAVERIADEREARTREAIAVGIEALICTPCRHEECCDDLRLAIEVARAGGKS